MKKLLFCLYVGLLMQRPACGQHWTVEDVKKQVPLILNVYALPLGDNKYHFTTVFDTVAPSPAFAELVKNHQSYLSYLTGSYSRIDFDKLRTPGISLTQANEALRKDLVGDTLFNRCFLELATYYLQAQGVAVKGYSPPPKPVLTMPALMQIAVSFFDRIEATANDHVVWHINLKSNPDYDKSVVGNQPLIEAFCIEAIMNWSTTPTWRELRYDKKFYEQVKSLAARTALLTDADDRRQVVRPAMRDLMTKSNVLEKVLLDEYQRSQNWLGFTLVH